MEQFDPSQISWTSFPNRHPSSVSQLWPPSNSSRNRETTPETITDSTLPPTTDTSLSDRHTFVDLSCLYLPPPEPFVGHAPSIESLRSFVNKEIGLNAIDHRMSLPMLQERPASSWYTSDSDSIDLATWTREQTIRAGRNENVRNGPAERNGAPVEAESTARSKAKRHYFKELKEKCRNNTKGVARRAKAAAGKISEKIGRLIGWA